MKTPPDRRFPNVTCQTTYFVDYVFLGSVIVVVCHTFWHFCKPLLTIKTADGLNAALQ